MRHAYHRQVAGVVCGALLGVGLSVSGTGARTWAAEEKPIAAVQNNMDVGLEYTLTVDGAVVDTTEGKQTFHYVHGREQIVPGLERQLAGLHIGDSKEITVGPEEGYGKIKPLAEIPKEQLPKDVIPAVGMALRGVNPDGKSFRAIVREVKDKTVVLDLNHRLAGKTLNFKIKVVSIAPASAS